MDSTGVVYVAIGLALGAVIGWLLARQKLSGEVIRNEERIKAKEKDNWDTDKDGLTQIKNLICFACGGAGDREAEKV